MYFTIKNEIVKDSLGIPEILFPKYTTQLINLAGSNAAATRPKIVGQMSDLTVKSKARTLNEWRNYYTKSRPEAHKAAADKIENMIDNLREAMKLIDRNLIEMWVDDLLINKTFFGFGAQDVILEEMAKRTGLSLKQSSASDESKGIDGYLGSHPVSVKPTTYKQKVLEENISCPIIYYQKTSYGIRIDAAEFSDKIAKK
tara:strand:+ start:120 stop:719 length:600 start_codon:yes stop_codon:yes gene_type:complete